MVPAKLAAQVTKELSVPTIGIGAGVDCDAQVLVWPDMAGLNGGGGAEFVEKYAHLRGEVPRGARGFPGQGRGGALPRPPHPSEEVGRPGDSGRALGGLQ